MAAYLIGDIEITDPAVYEEYRRRVPDVIAAYGGRYLVRGGKSSTLEGSWRLGRSVVLEFPSMTALTTFWESPEYRPLRAIRERASRSNIVAIEGV